MAVQVMAWVFDHAPQDLKPSEMLVALVLADHANAEGGLAYPSVKRICRMTRLAERTVQGALQTLMEIGVIQRHMAANGPRPDVYCFPTFRGAGSAGVNGGARGAGSAGVSPSATPAKNDMLPPQILRKSEATPIKEPSEEPLSPPTPSRGGAKPRRRIPEDWEMSDALRAYAIDHGIEERRVDEFAEEFHSFWLGDGRPKASWDQVFRSRVLEVTGRSPRKKGSSLAESSGIVQPRAVPPEPLTPEELEARRQRDLEAAQAYEAQQREREQQAIEHAARDPTRPPTISAERWAGLLPDVRKSLAMQP